MKIICVKWGNKYSSEYVNKLYRMIQRHAPNPVQMYCMTEQPAGIDGNINIIPLPIDNDYEVWWNKMYMFQQFYDDTHLFFDLDIIIHGSLDFFFQYDPATPTFISSTWKDPSKRLDTSDTLINSSVVMWKDARYIWEQFQIDPEKYMTIYKGIDRFIWNEKIEHDTFPPNHIYSYWKGVDLQDTEPGKFRKDYSVCIVNHNPKPHEIAHSWIHDHWK